MEEKFSNKNFKLGSTRLAHRVDVGKKNPFDETLS